MTSETSHPNALLTLAHLLGCGRSGDAASLVEDADLLELGSIDAEEAYLALAIAEAFAEEGALVAARSLLAAVAASPDYSKLPASIVLEIVAQRVELSLLESRQDDAENLLDDLVETLTDRYGVDCAEIEAPLARLTTITVDPRRKELYRNRLSELRSARGRTQLEASRSLGIGKSKISEDDGLRFLDIFYFTHRSRTAKPDAQRFYSGGRGTLEFGVAEVAVRVDPKLARLPDNRILRIEFRKSADSSCLRQVTPFVNRAGFYERLRTVLGKSKRREVMMFVHGFNVSFRGAIECAGKMSADLDIDGATVVYSWPSQGNVFSYFVDRNNKLQTYVEDLASEISVIARQLQPQSLLVVAHSLGSEFLLGALQSLHRSMGDQIRVSEVVFASPDVDRQDFVDRITPLVGLADRMTLYASKNDRALWISQALQSYERAGNSGAPAVIAGIDTIDTSLASGGLIGHSDFSGSALDDLRAIAWTNLPASQRSLLVPTSNSSGTFWRMLSPRLPELAVESAAFSTALALTRRMGAKAPQYASESVASADTVDQILLAKGRRLLELLRLIVPACRFRD